MLRNNKLISLTLIHTHNIYIILFQIFCSQFMKNSYIYKFIYIYKINIINLINYIMKRNLSYQ